MKYEAGFTLIELLVATLVFAIISAIAYSGLNYVLDTSAYLSDAQQRHRQLIVAMMRIENDFSQARNRPVRDIDGTLNPALIGRPTDTRAMGTPAVELTRGGLPIVGGAPRTDLQRIAYRLNDEGILYRVTWPVLDRSATTEPQEMVLLKDVEEFRLRFYQRDKSPNWLDSWPEQVAQNNQAKQDKLPAGIEMQLKLKNQETITRLFHVGT